MPKNFNPKRVFGFLTRDTVIKDKIKKDKDVIYGARSINAQFPAPFQRSTQDFDVYSKTPNLRAKQMERVLDKHSCGNYFYTKPAMHPGTYKVMDIGFDNKKGTYDDFGVVDYTKPTKKIKTVKKDGVIYAHYDERKKDARSSLRDPMFKFRHEKDKKDLYRIKKGLELRRFLGW